ncbi:hypothetical protein GCM10023094_35430 [Rhodococcus olei]|uniref:Type VII secretion-associated protein (TIGR03931 family) n=1 Tax=Rhodococcus olei TaxID=2161675 RepID=A0ABP8P8H8_9NOCA
MAAVHLTETTVWARQGDRIVERPAGVRVGTGGLESGVGLDQAVQADAVEPYPIRYVDDEVVLLGSTAVPVAEVLAALVADAVTAAGASVPVDLLVLTVPSRWGTRRRRVLAAAGRTAARDVRLIPVADAVTRAVGADDAGVVVELGTLQSAASSTVVGDGISLDALGAGDIAECPDAAQEFVTTVGAWHPRTPPWVALTGEAAGPRLVAELRRCWGVAPRVLEVSGGAVVAAAHRWGVDALGGHPARASRARGVLRRPWITAAAAAAAVVAAAAVGVAMWGWDRPVPGVAPDAAPAAARVASGRADVALPPGWHERTPSAGPDRVELVRDDGRPARILLVHKELNPGADLDGVGTTLAARIADHADTFGSLERVEVDTRPGLAYVERPDPDSQVRWLVVVGDGLQVSIGCQALAGRMDDVEPACGDIVRSLNVAGR